MRAGRTWTITTIPRRIHERGDVILVRFPHPSGLRGKKRPAVIVQSDAYAGRVGTFVVAEVTKNVTMASDPACLFVSHEHSRRTGYGSGSRFRRILSCARNRVRRLRRPGNRITLAGHEAQAQ